MERRRDRQQHGPLARHSPWRSRSPVRPPVFAPETTIWPPPLSLASSHRPPEAAAASQRDLLRLVGLGAEQGGHRALADRDRLLHRLSAQAQQPRGVGDGQGARRGQRRIFAERMAGDESGVARDIDALFRSPAPAGPPGSPPSRPAGRWRSASTRRRRPSNIRADSFSPSAASTSSKTARADGKGVMAAPCPCRRPANPGREKEMRRTPGSALFLVNWRQPLAPVRAAVKLATRNGEEKSPFAQIYPFFICLEENCNVSPRAAMMAAFAPGVSRFLCASCQRPSSFGRGAPCSNSDTGSHVRIFPLFEP